MLEYGIRYARELVHDRAVRRAARRELAPGANVTGSADLRDYIRRVASTVWHPVGTCKMGPESDAAAVVDDRLRVRGIDGLRIADASVMPKLVNGNPNAAIMMIAERAADLIRREQPAAAVVPPAPELGGRSSHDPSVHLRLPEAGHDRGRVPALLGGESRGELRQQNPADPQVHDRHPRARCHGETGDPLWSGVAEIWLANEEEQLASLQTPEFLKGARADEPKWAAFWRRRRAWTRRRIRFCRGRRRRATAAWPSC